MGTLNSHLAGRLKASIVQVPVVLALTLSSCGAPGRDEGPKHSVERSRVAMGSELHLTAWTTDDLATLAGFDEVFAEFERLEALMRNWREDSDINRRNAPAGERPVKV